MFNRLRAFLALLDLSSRSSGGSFPKFLHRLPLSQKARKQSNIIQHYEQSKSLFYLAQFLVKSISKYRVLLHPLSQELFC